MDILDMNQRKRKFIEYIVCIESHPLGQLWKSVILLLDVQLFKLKSPSSSRPHVTRQCEQPLSVCYHGKTSIFVNCHSLGRNNSTMRYIDLSKQPVYPITVVGRISLMSLRITCLNYTVWRLNFKSVVSHVKPLMQALVKGYRVTIFL